ncbi:MAG TPA: rhodanese-like domain-containing protein [Thermodesulfobacteriaceae bacterium]|nr:rhodanese-like domain-containing protein [Thermodesulfobacteriaceae bacterium]
MKLKQFLKPVRNMSSDQARKFMAQHSPGEYTLLDVRQEKEYERGHIPGAKLIPLSRLPARLDELDPEKPVIAY